MIHPRTLESLEFNKIINHIESLCRSSGGRALAKSIAPLQNSGAAEAAFRLYEQTSLWAAKDSSHTISSFPDVNGIFAKVGAKQSVNGLPPSFFVDIEDLWALRELLRLANVLTESIRSPESLAQWPDLLAKVERYPFPAQLLAALNRCLTDDGLLKDESSPELFRLRNDLRRLHQSCLKKVREYAQQYNMLSYLQDEFMTLSSDRYVLPLKTNFKGRMQGIIHDWSQTGETCYFEPYFLVDINNRLQELKHEEREEERKVLKYLTSLLDSELEGAQAASRLLEELDRLQAIRLFSEKISGILPAFCSSNGGIELLQARHPLLSLARMDNKDANPVKPVDIILRPGERALIITGGNAGGKTVCLKSLGLLSAMAMSGLPIPAEKGSRLPWFNRIDAFIGDEQSIAENVSTFSAQIDHLAKAFRHLDDNGLAILDEFGAGTDPAEGAALAQATHDELLEKKCFVISATHFPALKTYALSRSGARAATMLFDPSTNKPLFKLAYDQVGASQALAVAAEHGLPQGIIDRAKHYLLQDGEDSDVLLKRLNALAAEREKEISNLRKEQEKAKNILSEQKENLAKEKKRLQNEIQEKIKTLMTAWQADKRTAKQTLKAMSGLREELGLPNMDAPQSILPPVASLAAGQKVFHTGFNKNGVITDINERRRQARIDLNGVSVWAKFDDLRVSAQNSTNEASTRSHIPTGKLPFATTDVRGLRAEEAIKQVEKVLDDAIISGASEIEIIHGRGTGALRREIHNFLRSFPSVASITLAPEDRGGDGMTIATIK